MSDKDLIADALEQFKQADEAHSENMADALDDIRFARLAEQWPEAIRRQRELEQRPCLTINRLPAFIRQVVNDGRMNRPQIRTVPSGSGSDQETAEILNGLIRNIQVASDADVAYDTGLEFAVTGGFGFWRVDVDFADDDVFEQDLKISRIANPFTVRWDPHSQAADSSDWGFAFVTDLIPKEQFERQYKGAQTSSFEADKDAKDQLWFQDDAVRVAEWWQREKVKTRVIRTSAGNTYLEPEFLKIAQLLQAQGITVVGDRPTETWKVTQRLITGAEVLDTTEWRGKYIPVIPVWGDEVNVEGKRHFRSLVRDAKDYPVSQ